jgi:hypothetical protein
MTRGELIKDLKNLIGPAVEVDDAGLAVWINDAYTQVIDEIIKVNPDFYTKTATSSTVNGQQEYTLPSDFEKMAKLEIEISGVWTQVLPMGTNADIRFVPSIQKARAGDANYGYSTAEPYYYIYGNAILGLMPIPAETTANNIKAWYTYTPPELTDDNQSPDFPARYHHILKFHSYANYMDQDDNHAAAERMRQRFENYVARMIQNVIDRQVDILAKSVELTQNQDLYSRSGRII